MNYSIKAFNAGTFWVPGPEVYWMERWGTREEMNVIIYLVRGGGHNILIKPGIGSKHPCLRGSASSVLLKLRLSVRTISCLRVSSALRGLRRKISPR